MKLTINILKAIACISLALTTGILLARNVKVKA